MTFSDVAHGVFTVLNNADCLSALQSIAEWILKDKLQRDQRDDCDVFI